MLVRINKPLFATLLLIGCLSSIMPVAAAIVPALGGYTTRESMSYEATESQIMGYAQPVAVGCYPYYGGQTICYDPYEVLSATSWEVVATFPNFWRWSKTVETRMPIRYTRDGVNITTSYEYKTIPIALTYFCPNDSYRFVDDLSSWQPGAGRPTCTDESTPPPAVCSGQGGYIIDLQGPGGTSGALADVEPGAPVTTLRARVTCAGQPAGGKRITLAADVTAYSGGHQHDQGRRPQHTGTVSFNGSDTTDANGEVAFTFTAPVPAGDHTITARCTDGSCGTTTGSVWVGIKGLEPIIPASDPATGPLYVLIGQDAYHPSNHSLTPAAIGRLQQLAALYRQRFPNSPPLHLNDASLERGGLFDIYWRNPQTGTQRTVWWTPPHFEHRRGTVIDVRANRAMGAVPNEPRVRSWFETTIRNLPGSFLLESLGTSNEHYHIRLMGVAE